MNYNSYNNITETIYEPITEKYGWAKYGEFKVIMDRQTGYINGTKLCKEYGKKELFSWTKIKQYEELVDSLSSVLNKNRSELSFVINGGTNQITWGTYLHPLLIPSLAGWIHPKFAISAAKLINDYIVSEYKEELRKLTGDKKTLLDKVDGLLKDNRTLLEKLDSANFKIDKLSVQLRVANENIIESLDNLGVVSNKQVPLERTNPTLLEDLVLLHLEAKRFQVVRTQRRATSKALKRIRNQFPTARIVMRMESRPNSKELWNAIKEKLIRIGCKATINEFELEGDMTEDKLIELIRETNNEKFKIFSSTRDTIRETLLSDEDIGGQTGETEGETEEDSGEETDNSTDKDKVSNEAVMATQLLLKTRSELIEIARASGRRGFSKLKKVELVNWIVEH
jgi:hypothetical protein